MPTSNGSVVSISTDAQNPNQRRVLSSGPLLPVSLTSITRTTLEQASTRSGHTKLMAEGYIEYANGMRKAYTVIESWHEISRDRAAFIMESSKKYDVSVDMMRAMYSMGALREPASKRRLVKVGIAYVNIEIDQDHTCVLMAMMTDWHYARELAAVYAGIRWLDTPPDIVLTNQQSLDLWYLLAENHDIMSQLNNLYAHEDDHRALAEVQRKMAVTIGEATKTEQQVKEAWHTGEQWPATSFDKLLGLRGSTDDMRNAIQVFADPNNGLEIDWLVVESDEDYILLADMDALQADLDAGDPNCGLMVLLTRGRKGTVANIVGGTTLSTCYSIIRTILCYLRAANGRDIASFTNQEIANIMANLPELAEVAS